MAKSTIDLHIHSTGSDGTDSPETIIEKSKHLGLKLISITDHDCVDSLYIGKNAEEAGIRFVNGVELSVIYKHPFYKEGKKDVELHILGYDFDFGNRELKSVLDENRAYRQWRAHEIVNRVNTILSQENKPIITEREFDDLTKNIEGSLGRPHLARLLLRKGIVRAEQEAFDKYLINCDVPKKELSLEHGSDLVRSAGGLVVLAHPHGGGNSSLLKITPYIEQQAIIIRAMLPYIDGIECFYGSHTPSEAQQYAEIAKGLELIVTGGTDHHGGGKDSIGQTFVPEYVADFFNR